jgi:hypothetical protein
MVSLLQCCPYFGVALGRPEPHDDVIGLDKRFEPGSESEGQIKSRERAFADNHRVHEFNGDVLGVGSIWSTSKSQQASAVQKTLGHFATSLSQPRGFHREERFENLIASEQTLFNLRDEFDTGSHVPA